MWFWGEYRLGMNSKASGAKPVETGWGAVKAGRRGFGKYLGSAKVCKMRLVFFAGEEVGGLFFWG